MRGMRIQYKTNGNAASYETRGMAGALSTANAALVRSARLQGAQRSPFEAVAVVGPRQHPTAMCQQRDDEIALSRRRLANSPRECSCLDHPAGHLATGRSAADQVLVATRSR